MFVCIHQIYDGLLSDLRSGLPKVTDEIQDVRGWMGKNGHVRHWEQGAETRCRQGKETRRVLGKVRTPAFRAQIPDMRRRLG